MIKAIMSILALFVYSYAVGPIYNLFGFADLSFNGLMTVLWMGVFGFVILSITVYNWVDWLNDKWNL